MTEKQQEAVAAIEESKNVKLKDGTIVLYPKTKASLIENDGQIKSAGIQGEERIDIHADNRLQIGTSIGTSSTSSIYMSSDYIQIGGGNNYANISIIRGTTTSNEINLNGKKLTIAADTTRFTNSNYRSAPLLGTDSVGFMEKITLGSGLQIDNNTLKLNTGTGLSQTAGTVKLSPNYSVYTSTSNIGIATFHYSTAGKPDQWLGACQMRPYGCTSKEDILAVLALKQATNNTSLKGYLGMLVYDIVSNTASTDVFIGNDGEGGTGISVLVIYRKN